MLSNEEIKKHKELVDKVNSLSSVKQDIISTGKAKRQQGLEIAKSFDEDCDNLKEAAIGMQKELDRLEELIKKQGQEAEEEIVAINKLKSEVDNILLG
jgi:hypothetical protein